ncbi:thioredoxin family protein [Mucilaginibacter segetis]|uniref:Thioredoxin fold domain-containing protein n=1 Tax=Mucilaginibacter segetis TaxID=2793071 RepID=A0A934PTD9_9SPHI|nr:thioredoxin fold domain-containing protein [Mucilaginibacter segetis]MBK0380478.1 thioredoxin fold domain-containing protein [Mucilaginibacter segetis]
MALSKQIFNFISLFVSFTYSVYLTNKVVKLRKFYIFFILLFPFAVFAQNGATHFEHGLSWAEVKQKAKKEHKYIYLDCFTTWCGPCKYVTNTIFPQPKVGNFFNKNFLTVKVQFDKTNEDNEEVRSWYLDAANLAKDYSINAYPTFLVFSPDGEMVQKIVGAGEADDFISFANKALNPKTQYSSLLKKYNAGNREPEVLKALTVAVATANEVNLMNKIATEYLETQKDLYTKPNIKFIENYTTNSKSKGFEIALKNPQKIDSVMGAGTAYKILSDIIISEEITPIARQKEKNVDFDALAVKLKTKYPSIDFTQYIKLTQIRYYQRQENWNNFRISVSQYLNKYASYITPNELNEFAWDVFEGCSDPACITEALLWSKQSVEKTGGKDAMLLDTYANLLHKSGDTKEAIKTERQAINLVLANEKPAYQATIDKMIKGEKTW